MQIRTFNNTDVGAPSLEILILRNSRKAEIKENTPLPMVGA